MSKKVILEFLKKYGLLFLGYFKGKIWSKVKEVAKDEYDHFKEALWNSIKADVKEQLQTTIVFIETFFNSPNYKEKEEAVIDTLMKNIKLPVYLKPFRGALKRILHNKLKKLVEKGLKKLNSLS